MLQLGARLAHALLEWALVELGASAVAGAVCFHKTKPLKLKATVRALHLHASLSAGSISVLVGRRGRSVKVGVAAEEVRWWRPHSAPAAQLAAAPRGRYRSVGARAEASGSAPAAAAAAAAADAYLRPVRSANKARRSAAQEEGHRLRFWRRRKVVSRVSSSRRAEVCGPAAKLAPLGASLHFPLTSREPN